MTTALVIGRWRKGREVALHVDETSKALRAAGWTVEGPGRQAQEGPAESVPAMRRRRGSDVVVAVGGDGGVLQVATALAGLKTVLGIIPLGTGNLLAGNLTCPRSRPTP